MNANAHNTQSNEKSGLTGPILKRFLQVGVSMLIYGAILFISSGRLDWTMAWAFIGVCVSIIAINALVILPKSPELIAERGQIVKEDTKSWDKVIGGLYVAGGLATLLLAGLDARFGWSPQLALALQLVALVFMALGYGLVSWAMASNKFFSSTVRIQEERGHTVATGGPYQFVRHPGYVGIITAWLATALMLSSLWALIPAGLVGLLFIVRTALEDRTLQDELDGYQDYARRVRYRLLPGVW